MAATFKNLKKRRRKGHGTPPPPSETHALNHEEIPDESSVQKEQPSASSQKPAATSKKTKRKSEAANSQQSAVGSWQSSINSPPSTATRPHQVTGRLKQFGTRVHPAWDEAFRARAKAEKITMAELMERSFAAYELMDDLWKLAAEEGRGAKDVLKEALKKYRAGK